MANDENFDFLDDMTPDHCRQTAHMWDIGDQLDAAQEQLERVAHDDLMGFTMFGDRDEWLEPRLSGQIDTRPK